MKNQPNTTNGNTHGVKLFDFTENLYLIGFMGSGKTRQGELLALALQRPFVDTDALLVEEYDMSISDMFRKYGEPAFRDMELEKLRELARRGGQVVALGGGTVIREAPWPVLRASGVSIYLKRSIPQLVSQLRKFENRPLLRNTPVEELARLVESMLRIREPFYRRADLVFDCEDGWEKEDTAQHLYAFLETAFAENSHFKRS